MFTQCIAARPRAASRDWRELVWPTLEAIKGVAGYFAAAATTGAGVYAANKLYRSAREKQTADSKAVSDTANASVKVAEIEAKTAFDTHMVAWIRALQQDVEDGRRERVDLTKQLQAYEVTISRLEGQINALITSDESKTVEMVRMRDENRHVKMQYESEVSRLHDENVSITSELRALRAENTVLRGDKEFLTARVRFLEGSEHIGLPETAMGGDAPQEGGTQ